MTEAAAGAAAGGAAAGGEGGAAAGAAAAGAASPWHTGLDADTLGHAQTLGWHEKKADEVAREAVKAHREARKFIGVPETQLIRLPADPVKDADGMRAVWQKLGAPKDAKDYDFSSVKSADGTAIDPTFAEAIRASAFAQNVPKDAATAFAQSVVKHLDSVKASQSTETAAKITEEKAALSKDWGKNFDANKFIASQAAQKLGIAPETVAALEKMDGVGYAKVMQMFHGLGLKMGEDKFIAGENPANNGVMTQQQAVARKAELMKDTAWGEKYLKGDPAARREMEALDRMITGIFDAA